MRQTCPNCGAWTDNPRLFAWFTERHTHPVAIPIVYRTQASPDAFGAVFAKYGYIAHQVAPASTSALAVFVSSNAADTIDKATRILVRDEIEMDALFSAGRKL